MSLRRLHIRHITGYEESEEIAGTLTQMAIRVCLAPKVLDAVPEFGAQGCLNPRRPIRKFSLERSRMRTLHRCFLELARALLLRKRATIRLRYPNPLPFLEFGSQTRDSLSMELTYS